MKVQILTILITFLSILQCRAQWSVLDNDTAINENWYLVQRFTPEEWASSNFADPGDLQWFTDARYGMFIHFGLSAYIGTDLSWGMCQTRKAPDQGQGPIPDSIWVQYPRYFEFKDFDAKEWVETAKKAGMKYIVTVAKHHDGFHLWDTRYSDFKVTNTPFGRDYLKEMSDACHEAGMKFGIYYSQRDWYHPDYAPVDTAQIERIAKPPYFRAKPGIDKVTAGPTHRDYLDYQFNVVRELCTNYGKIDVFWFDACWWGGMFTADMWESEKLTRMVRELQPGIIINNRSSIPGDFDTPEQRIGRHQIRPWESCITLCGTWSWSDTPVKPARTIIQILTATAGGNGNLLLSWGPFWNGAYDPKQTARLKEVGAWLEKYGHTIYGTSGGPWYPDTWGAATSRDNVVWLHITDSAVNNLVLPVQDNRLLAVRLITGGELNYSQDGNYLNIGIENAGRNELSVIAEITFERKIENMFGRMGRKSLFADPVYGNIIRKMDKLSPVSGVMTIDLDRVYSVTGIELLKESAGEGRYVIEISEEGNLWTKVDEPAEPFTHREVTVAQFSAGILLPGVNARYIRITLNGSSEKMPGFTRIGIYGR
jgi:alpha-L-fucosidase